VLAFKHLSAVTCGDRIVRLESDPGDIRALLEARRVPARVQAV
jgi:hypothetical protein